MPYKSDAQRRFMHARHPEIAARWDAEIRAKKKKPVAKSSRLMSDAEIKHRKKVQGTISRTTSTLGLTGLGLTGAAALASKKPGVLRAVKRVPGMKKATPEKMKNLAINTSLVSGGIGGVGGYNFAAYTNAESRKRKVVAKRWTPAATSYDPETRRVNRSRKYQHALDVGSTAAAGGAAVAGAKTVQSVKELAQPKYKVSHTLPRAKVIGAGKRGALTAGLVGAAVAGEGVKRKMHKKTTTGSWSPYAKSAFGVEEISKIGEWKTIDQRERSQVRARKTMRAAGAGLGLGAAALIFGHACGGTASLKAVGRVARGSLKHPEISGKDALRNTARAAETHIKRNPGGAGSSIGGAGLIAGSAAVGGAAKAGHTYHQHKINERRRARFKKSDNVSAFGIDHS